MKKIIYIGLLTFGVALVSCEKQAIEPNVESVEEKAPEWSPNRSSGDKGNITIDNTVTNDNGGEIVDPNNDSDGKKKKKKSN